MLSCSRTLHCLYWCDHDGYPFAYHYECCFEPHSTGRWHQRGNYVDGIGQVEVLLRWRRHLESTKCLVYAPEDCLAPEGKITWLQLGSEGPICRLTLVSFAMLLNCYVYLLQRCCLLHDCCCLLQTPHQANKIRMLKERFQAMNEEEAWISGSSADE